MGSQRVGHNLATEQQHWVAACHREPSLGSRDNHQAYVQMLYHDMKTAMDSTANKAPYPDGLHSGWKGHSISVVLQSLRCVWLFATLWTAACQASLSFTICWIFSNSCPLSQWCHPTILSSIASFSSYPQSFPASGSFLMSQLFASGGQSSGASASASVFPMNTQGWFPLGLTGLIF